MNEDSLGERAGEGQAGPTSAPRNVQEKWSHLSCDRNFNHAWGDSSPLELGRVMSNECWLRCEALLVSSERHVPHATLSSTGFGPMRRDPQGALRARGARNGPALHRQLQSVSAMDSFAVTSRRSRGHAGTLKHPVGSAPSVAPFGVSTITCGACKPSAVRERRSPPTRSKKPTVVDPSMRAVPHATVGDGCPGVVTMNQLRVAAKEVMDGPYYHHVPRVFVTRGGTGLSGFGGR
jgi:hypothetical protein